MRFRMILGGVLMALAFIFLFGFIVFPVIPQLGDAPVFDSLLGAILCAPDQTLIRDPYSQTFGSETNFSMDVYCQDTNEKRIDVTDKWGEIGMVGYLVPFLLGLFLFIFSFNGLQKQKQTQEFAPYRIGNADREDIADGLKGASLNYGVANDVSVKDGVIKIGNAELKINDFSPQQIEDFKRRVRTEFGSADDSVKFVTKNTTATLSDKLKQIQDAHENGLIDGEEYERLRQHILDEMK